MKATVKTSATKDDNALVLHSIKDEFEGLRQDIRDWKRDIIMCMFILSLAYVAVFLTIVLLLR